MSIRHGKAYSGQVMVPKATMLKKTFKVVVSNWELRTGNPETCERWSVKRINMRGTGRIGQGSDRDLHAELMNRSDTIEKPITRRWFTTHSHKN